MAFSNGAQVTHVGNSTINSGTGQTTISAVLNANALAGDLSILVQYTSGGDLLAQPPRADAGQWRFAYHYDTANAVGMIVGWGIATRPGAAGHGNIVVPTSTHLGGSATYRISAPFQWDLPRVLSAETLFFDAAAGLPLTAPEGSPPSGRYLDLIIRGHTNVGLATSVAAITGWTQRFYFASANAKGATLSDREMNSPVLGELATSNLGATRTNRMGLRLMVPIVGDPVGVVGRHQGAYRRVG